MRRLHPSLWRLLVSLVTLSFLLGIVAILFPRQILTIDSGDVRADAIVVLGGGADQGRPERAAELFKAGKAPIVLISGGGDDELNERLLKKNGVPETALKIENASTSTLENAMFSVPMLRQMGAHRVIIVTSWYHSRRALACFQHFAPDMNFYSCPSTRGYSHLKGPLQGMRGHLVTEYVKLLGYWVWYGVYPLERVPADLLLHS